MLERIKVMKMSSWTKYKDEKPKDAGVYKWRQKHKASFVQIFYAEMRMRGNGGRGQVLSPAFDYWDGYAVHVPDDLEWCVPDDTEDALRRSKYKTVEVEGVSLKPCPFCGKTPEISGSQCGRPGGGDGTVVCAKPENFNTWRLTQCCRMVSSFNGFPSPFDLSEKWNARYTPT